MTSLLTSVVTIIIYRYVFNILPPLNLSNLVCTNQQLLNETEYHLKNYGDRGGCYTASTGNALRNLHSSSDDRKAEFNNFFIIQSK